MERNFCKNIIMLLLLLLFLAGCAPRVIEVPQVTHPMQPLPYFPPQKVMEGGDYGGFLAENERLLKECSEANDCEIALFNLGFVYTYTKSPYRNQAKALHYFEELVKKYPHSPWAFQAMAWIDLIKKNIAIDNICRRLRGTIKSKDSAVNELVDEMKEELKSKDSAIDELQDRTRRSRETIDELQERMRRSRDIDVDIDKRERKLLQ